MGEARNNPSESKQVGTRGALIKDQSCSVRLVGRIVAREIRIPPLMAGNFERPQTSLRAETKMTRHHFDLVLFIGDSPGPFSCPTI